MYPHVAGLSALFIAPAQQSERLPDLTALLRKEKEEGKETATTTVISNTHNALLHSCLFASAVAKKASEYAFADKGRSMTAPDAIQQIGRAFENCQ